MLSTSSATATSRSVVSFESESGKEPQDFQLFYTISKEDFGLTLLTHREAGKHGYFLLMISPKDDWSEQEYSAKDVVFVVDTSGSMAEEGKMEKARAALLYGVQNSSPAGSLQRHLVCRRRTPDGSRLNRRG